MRIAVLKNSLLSLPELLQSGIAHAPQEKGQKLNTCSILAKLDKGQEVAQQEHPHCGPADSEHGCSILAESVCGCWPQHLQQGEQGPGLACGQVCWSSLSDTEAGNGCQTSAWSSHLCVPTYTFLLSPCDDLPCNSSST